MCGICGFTTHHPNAACESGTADGPEKSDAATGNFACESDATAAAVTACEADARILKAMCDEMAHRGPDGEGFFFGDGIALGHRRLSLIDFEGGAQPLVSESSDDTLALVYNGEIYNYRELRAELEAQGTVFATESDTEVLLEAYRKWGRACLPRLRGMFAFAIWDSSTRELFCARDAFGIKPLYYTVADGNFIFASEIKSILKHPAYKRELNTDALAPYLAFQFSVLPETFFKGIFQLQPGCCLSVRAADGDAVVQTERWWDAKALVEGGRYTDEYAANRLEKTLRDSVEHHLLADAKVGSLLSGGIDSTFVAALARESNPDIATFTVGFSDCPSIHDEVSHVREVAEQAGLANESRSVSEAEYWDAVPSVLWHMDEPTGDPAAVALWFVDKLAARTTKAVLSGEGADELFGGYRIYQAPLTAARVRRIPKRLRRGAAKTLRRLGKRGANYLERSCEDVSAWYYTNANGVAFSEDELDALLKPGIARSAPQDLVAPLYDEVAGAEASLRMQYVDVNCWLPRDILMKTDKMAMAHSLEARVPFLDERVFREAAHLTLRQRITVHETKTTLRKAAEGVIPEQAAHAPKLGFPVPLATWLRRPARIAEIRTAFSSATAERFFDVEELRTLLARHLRGEDMSRRIWMVYAFLVWYRLYFGDDTGDTQREADDRDAGETAHFDVKSCDGSFSKPAASHSPAAVLLRWKLRYPSKESNRHAGYSPRYQKQARSSQEPAPH